MELVYAWVEKFRNFNQVHLNFSDKFIINYNQSNKSIFIAPNTSYISIYPKYITNINAVVGRNGVGKTNLLDALGLRTNDRNKNNGEFEIRYKKKSKFGYRVPDDIEAEIKHSIYFFLYYMGKDSNNQDLFCIEGNDIESFQKVIKNGSGLSIDYWRSKYWFAFLCNYSEGKLIHKNDLNVKLGDYRTETYEDGIRVYGYSRTEQDKLAIISLRENLNEKYYDFSSTKPEDDYKISVPRRVAKFHSKLLTIKIEMLYKQLQKPKKLMFKDIEYTLKIHYNNYFLTNGFDDKNKLLLLYSYKDLVLKESAVCKVLESFIQYFFNSINDNLSNEMMETLEKRLTKLKIIKTFKGYKDYYLNVLKVISDIYFSDMKEEQHLQDYILKSYLNLADVLSKNKGVTFYENYISLVITKKINIKKILEVIDVTVDEAVKSDFNEMPSIFGNFFDYSIENLSDGEVAYLGLYASLFEQVALLTPTKTNYIILLDEPEARMHPELTRNFLNELILFLGDLSEDKKSFQVITSTHSPFILSDIPSNNITYLEKDNVGHCKTVKRGLNTFGTNIHTLLKDGFFMSSTMGEFATTKIKEVISLITKDNIGNLTEKQKNECLYIINTIGEPLIRNRIMKMFNDKYYLDYTDLYNENLTLKGKLKQYEEPRKINESIEILKKQIESLQGHVSELEDKLNDKNSD